MERAGSGGSGGQGDGGGGPAPMGGAGVGSGGAPGAGSSPGPGGGPNTGGTNTGGYAGGGSDGGYAGAPNVGGFGGGWGFGPPPPDGKPLCNGDEYTRLTLIVRPSTVEVSADRQFLRGSTGTSGKDTFALVDGRCHYVAGDVTRGYVAEGTLSDGQAAALERVVAWSSRENWERVFGDTGSCAASYLQCPISPEIAKTQIGLLMDQGLPVDGSVQVIAWRAADFEKVGDPAYALSAPRYEWPLNSDLAVFVSNGPDDVGLSVSGRDAMVLRALRARAFQETKHTCFFASSDQTTGTGYFVAVRDLDAMGSFWYEAESSFYIPL